MVRMLGDSPASATIRALAFAATTLLLAGCGPTIDWAFSAATGDECKVVERWSQHEKACRPRVEAKAPEVYCYKTLAKTECFDKPRQGAEALASPPPSNPINTLMPGQQRALASVQAGGAVPAANPGAAEPAREAAEAYKAEQDARVAALKKALEDEEAKAAPAAPLASETLAPPPEPKPEAKKPPAKRQASRKPRPIAPKAAPSTQPRPAAAPRPARPPAQAPAPAAAASSD